MKKLREQLKFISSRVHLLAIAVVVSLLVLLLMDMVLDYKKGSSPVPVLFTLGILVVFVLLYVFWIYRPYQKREQMQNQFIDGYMTYDRLEDSDAKTAMLTPASKRETEKIRDILTSTELFNINKRQAQYLALQNQINPHFLYNTLDGIRSEALIAGVDHVAEMTEALATFFRYTISKDESLVSVAEELENCRIYFKIQQYRFGERIRLNIDCAEEDREKILQCRIPKLTLQPVLENSIIHGTEPKLGTGTQTIRLCLTGSRLLICVSDDGVGMSDRTLEELNDKLGRSGDQLTAEDKEKKGGIALYNVNHRIHLIFGEQYGLHVFSLENVGTDVEISIPIVWNERQIKDRGVHL